MIHEMIFFLLITLAYVLITKEFLDIFLEKRNVSFFLVLFTWLVFYVIQGVFANFNKNPIRNVLIVMVCTIGLCMILYKGTIKKKIIWSVLVNLIGMIVEAIVGYAFILLVIDLDKASFLGGFISKIILLMITMLLKINLKSKLRRDISFGYWFLLFLIPVGSIFILNTLFMATDYKDTNGSLLSAMISSVLLLIFNFLVFYIYENLSNRMELRKQEIIFAKQIELCKNQIQERETSNINIRNLKHDIENHLICIREYIERKAYTRAQGYIDDLLKGENYFNLNGNMESGNIVVDALLNHKNTTMEKLGITTNVHIEIPYKFNFNDADISVILGNGLDNAIEAVSKIPKLEVRIIDVNIVYRKNSLLFMISNPYIDTICKDREGNLLTTKSDAQNHGIGLASIKKAAQKYDGLVTISTNNDIFTLKVLLYS